MRYLRRRRIYCRSNTLAAKQLPTCHMECIVLVFGRVNEFECTRLLLGCNIAYNRTEQLALTACVAGKKRKQSITLCHISRPHSRRRQLNREIVFAKEKGVTGCLSSVSNSKDVRVLIAEHRFGVPEMKIDHRAPLKR